MNEEILDKYNVYLRQKYRKKNTRRCEYSSVSNCLKWIGKPVEEITMDDLYRWKIYLMDNYKTNGNIRRISSVNLFFRWYGKPELKLPVPRQEFVDKVILSNEEIEAYLNAAKRNPLWYLIALLQIDGIMRPGEFSLLKLSDIDWKNQKLHLEDTKTGNNHIILSPRIVEAIKAYLPYRNPLPEYEDYLIIIPNGKYAGRPPSDNRGEFIQNVTKRIAIAAGITKHVTPYTIKRSVITNLFNQHVNPRIIQRMARHRRIEYTLRYDHTTDDMVLEHFKERNHMQNDRNHEVNDRNHEVINRNHEVINRNHIDDLNSESKAKLLFERFLQGEIDVNMLKQGLEVLGIAERKSYEDLAYV